MDQGWYVAGPGESDSASSAGQASPRKGMWPSSRYAKVWAGYRVNGQVVGWESSQGNRAMKKKVLFFPYFPTGLPGLSTARPSRESIALWQATLSHSHPPATVCSDLSNMSLSFEHSNYGILHHAKVTCLHVQIYGSLHQ